MMPTVAAWAGPLVVVFWVGLVGGGVLAVVWRRIPPGRVRTATQWAASLAFFGPQVPILVAWNFAAPLVTLQRGLLASWLLVGATVPVLALRRTTRVRTGGWGTAVSVATSAAMLAGAAVLAVSAARDVAVDHVTFAGEVEVVTHGHRTMAPTLTIGGEPVRVTRDLARHLEPGMTVEGVALAGTRHILRID